MKASNKHIEKKAAKLLDQVVKKCKPVKELSAEDIHNLRTTVKRLDALLKFIVFMNGGKNGLKKTFKPIRKLFKVVGEIRKQQLLSESFIKDTSLHEQDKKLIENTFLGRRTKAIKAYEKLLKGGIRRELKHTSDEVQEAIKHLEIKDVKKYFRNREKKLEDIVGNKKLQGDDVHHARMLLKEVFYNAELLKIKEQIPVFNVSLENADQLLEKLGDWHDKFSDIQEYSTLVEDHKNSWKDLPGMKKLEQSLIKKEALMRRQMISQLRAVTSTNG